MCDSNDETMESRYHQDGGGEGDESSSYNLVDGYPYDKWLQEQDPMAIEVELAILKKDFSVSTNKYGQLLPAMADIFNFIFSALA